MISRTQKELTVEDISQIAETYHKWKQNSSSPTGRSQDEGSENSSSPTGRSQDEGSENSSSPTGRSQDEGKPEFGYADILGFCKSASIEDIKKHDYVLTPGRYVGAAPLEDDGILFETKMTELSDTLYGQMKESAKLDEVIRHNLKGLGYGE